MLKKALLKALTIDVEANLSEIWSNLEQKQENLHSQQHNNSAGQATSGEGGTDTPSCNEQIIGQVDFDRFYNALMAKELEFLQRFPVGVCMYACMYVCNESLSTASTYACIQR
jgi:hypothetical protein